MINRLEWAKKVRRCRRYSGLSISRFAIEMKVEKQTVWMWERGLTCPLEVNIENLKILEIRFVRV